MLDTCLVTDATRNVVPHIQISTGPGHTVRVKLVQLVSLDRLVGPGVSGHNVQHIPDRGVLSS
jgi:hypothetical protein